MSFLNKAFGLAKNLGVVAYGILEESANETRAIRQKYDELDDEELLAVVNQDGFFGKSSKERGIIFGILKRRGYQPEDMRKPKE